MVKVIIGGGDGTVNWVIEALNNSGIDVQKCIFGVMPLGNSNDLSSALGWGGKHNYIYSSPYLFIIILL